MVQLGSSACVSHLCILLLCNCSFVPTFWSQVSVSNDSPAATNITQHVLSVFTVYRTSVQVNSVLLHVYFALKNNDHELYTRHCYGPAF